MSENKIKSEVRENNLGRRGANIMSCRLQWRETQFGVNVVKGK